jgi:hypothetical protein
MMYFAGSLKPAVIQASPVGHGDSVGQASSSPVTAAVKIAPLEVMILGYADVSV